MACVKETRWVGTRARQVNGFKLWYSGGARGKNGVGILVDRDLEELVVDIKRVNDRIMTIKLVVYGFTLNVISAYAPQAGLGEEAEGYFWENLDEVVRGIPLTEKLFGLYEVHDRFDFGGRNVEGISLLEFAKAFDQVIANMCFQKKKDHLVTFRSIVAKTQIDYRLYRKCDRVLCTDCKVILSKCLSAQHMLLVLDLEIKRKSKKREVYVQPKIKWAALTKDKSHELG
ncbi:uncharacterized protein [Nicotiana tomentosiformis]|uniref:uncharacterized protein n=1 Tax=Nicotiana tomentosiformis TaxID=4098 RepID=UPI00388CCB1A